VGACCPWVRAGALEAAAGDSTGAVYFLRVHGVEMTTARAPSPEEGAVGADSPAGRGFGGRTFTATPESEGKPKTNPWLKFGRR